MQLRFVRSESAVANATVVSHLQTSRMSNLCLIGYFLSSAPAVILGFLVDWIGIPNAFLLFSLAAILSRCAGGAAMARHAD